MNKFHIFVLVNTIVFYFVLKRYKREVLSNDNSRLIYLMYTPTLLYSSYYLFSNLDAFKPIAQNALKEFPKSISSLSS